MAQITDYASLKAQLDNYTHRGGLSALYDVWIGIVESELNLELRLRQQITNLQLTTSGTNQLPLPIDFLQIRNLELNTSPITPLKFVTSEQKDFYDLQYSTGKPRLYDISGSNIVLAPTPDQTYVLNIEYYAKIPPLPTFTTNWLITNFPHLYLYGCLTQSAGYTTDAVALQIAPAAYTAAKAFLNKSDDDGMYNSAPRMRADVGW